MRSSNLREFFGVKEREPQPVKRRRGRPRKKRDGDEDFQLSDADDEPGSNAESEDDEPVVMKRTDSFLGTSLPLLSRAPAFDIKLTCRSIALHRRFAGRRADDVLLPQPRPLRSVAE
jgi:hypothetical protein